MTDLLAHDVMTVGIPTVTVLIGSLISNSRLSDLRASMDARFSDMGGRFGDVNSRFDDIQRSIDRLESVLRSDLLRMEQVMDARLKHLEEDRRR